jgi:hypothetical protein
MKPPDRGGVGRWRGAAASPAGNGRASPGRSWPRAARRPRRRRFRASTAVTLVHLGEVEHEAARQRHRLAVIAGAGAARRHRDAEADGGREHSMTSASLFGDDDDVGGDVLELPLQHRRVPVEVAALLLDEGRVVLGAACRRDQGGGNRTSGSCRGEGIAVRSCGAGSSGRRVRGSPAGSVDRPAGAQNDAVGLRPREEARSSARRRQDQVGRPPTAMPPAARKAGHDLGRRRRDRRSASPDRMVKLADARRPREDLQHVEVAIGVERVTGVVARDRNRDAALPSAHAAA